MHLLDVNVLIALGDADHPHHQRAAKFFLGSRDEGWATCPLTENGFLRIIGNPNYPKGPGSPEQARTLLNHLCSHPGHQFWPDALSLIDSKAFPKLPASAHLSDFYLLALAIHHKGKLATLDRRIDPTLLPGGKVAYFVIPE